jgi:hypothetical protein
MESRLQHRSRTVQFTVTDSNGIEAMIAELLLPPSLPPQALDSGVLRQGGRHDQPDGLGRIMGVGDLDSLFDVRKRGLSFRVRRESKYPAYQPPQRSASFLVNRLSQQTLSPFGCLLLRTT